MTHHTKIESWLVMGMPMSTATCACGEKKTFYPAESEKLGFNNEYTAARAWVCPKESS